MIKVLFLSIKESSFINSQFGILAWNSKRLVNSQNPVPPHTTSHDHGDLSYQRIMWPVITSLIMYLWSLNQVTFPELCSLSFSCHYFGINFCLMHMAWMLYRWFKVVMTSEKAFVLCALVHSSQERGKLSTHNLHSCSGAGGNIKGHVSWMIYLARACACVQRSTLLCAVCCRLPGSRKWMTKLGCSLSQFLWHVD